MEPGAGPGTRDAGESENRDAGGARAADTSLKRKGKKGFPQGTRAKTST